MIDLKAEFTASVVVKTGATSGSRTTRRPPGGQEVANRLGRDLL